MKRPSHAAAPQWGAFWAETAVSMLARTRSREAGLSEAEAAELRTRFGPNEIAAEHSVTRLQVLLDQLKSPLLLLLLFAAAVSLAGGQWIDASLVVAILAASVATGFVREYRAQRAAADLAAGIRLRSNVLRDGRVTRLDNRELVPGDVVLLAAGSLVPADGLLLEAAHLFVNEAMLTGESLPVEKRPGPVEPGARLGERSNCVFLGTSVRSGTGRFLVLNTGPATELGAIAHQISLRPAETEFERGLRRFGYLLLIAMLIMVLVVFAVNVFLGRPPADTLLFSIALAVGLSPELLPAILGVNLARGAQRMAAHGVLVKRLNAIENLGSMDVLCTDKTGTLTEGAVRLEGAWAPDGSPSPQVLALAGLNAALQSGLDNPLDDAITQAYAPPAVPAAKVGEIPYDFTRKRMSVAVQAPGGVMLITKGAVENVLAACTRTAAGELSPDEREGLRRRYRAWSARGIRVLAVAERRLPPRAAYDAEAEQDMVFAGFLTFVDPPKAGVSEAIGALRGLGVSLKMITGDSALVARHIAEAVGMRDPVVVTGTELDELHDEALWQSAVRTDIFAEVDPNQKERIILALKKKRKVVGFLGDGINDAPAMHAADASLSVEHAVDVARDAADFVLLDADLSVIRRGVLEGRKTFANTLKYILITTSANLGNMISMAAASLFLPFLPLLAGQVLLNNFLSDLPAVGIASDSVDAVMVEKPQRWSMRFIGWFMVEFGLLSSVFDVVTFGVLLYVFHAGEALFHTGWFVESLLTELIVVFILRTRGRAWRSRPNAMLFGITGLVAVLTLVLPFAPYAGVLGFVSLPWPVTAFVLGISAAYGVATETYKAGFFRRHAA